jgi:hypothetical protein
MSITTDFDYTLISEEQAAALQAISKLLTLRASGSLNDIQAMGADLDEALRICKDADIFTNWCKSTACPVTAHTATRLMEAHKTVLKDDDFKNFFGELIFATIRVDLIREMKASGVIDQKPTAEKARESNRKRQSLMRVRRREAGFRKVNVWLSPEQQDALAEIFPETALAPSVAMAVEAVIAGEIATSKNEDKA